MTSSLVLALSAVLATANPGQQAGAFDLVCGLTISHSDGATASDTRRFAVDPVARRVCDIEEGRCERMRPIRESANASMLDISHEIDSPDLESTVMTVDRYSGRLNWTWERTNGSTGRATGPCRREPFSGFPEAMF